MVSMTPSTVAFRADDADRRDADLLVDPLSFTVEGDGRSPIGVCELSVVSCPLQPEWYTFATD